MNPTKHTPNPHSLKKVDYPALFHFRIITETEGDVEQALLQVVSAYQVKAPLTPGRASAAGRYTAFSVSIVMQSRTEMETFDAVIKQVPGVRMLL